MKKRLGILSLFGITALMVAMIGAISALAAPSAAVTGTITFDKSWYTVDGTGKVTVTDADANTTTPTVEDDVSVGTAALANAEATANFALTSKPIVGTPVVVTVDTTTAVDGLEVQVVSATLGIVKILNGTGAAIPANTTYDIMYNVSAVDTVSVKLTSTQDATGITITATETGNDTGKFEVTFTVKDAVSSSTARYLNAINLNTITAKYTDTTPATGTADIAVSATATVETSTPTFASLLPAHATSTQATQPVISGVVNDSGGSGVDISTVTISIDLNSDGDWGDTNETATPTVTGSDGDATVSFTYTPPVLAEGTHDWYITAADMATNADRTDADTATTAVGDQAQELKVDLTAPSMASAETGKYWDSTNSVEKSNKLDRVAVTWNDDLNASTVSAADFLVEGAVPAAADVFSKAPTVVYLTLGAELAADKKPVVVIASGGAISDKAGNTANTGTVTASDTMAPTYTVSLDTTLSKTSVTATITSNESISGLPTVTVTNIDGVTVATLSPTVVTSTSWTAKFTAVAGHEGSNSILVAGNDLKGNAGSKGSTTIASGKFSSSSAITFTQDTTDPVLTFSPADDGETTETGPFVRVDFNEKVTVTKAVFGLKGETGTDILADGKMAESRTRWIYAASGLTVGAEYTIDVTVDDDAGNDKQGDATFEVKEVAEVEVPLKPGMNLVSLPSDPGDTAINSVITSDDVLSVMTYDPSNPDPDTGSPWLSASRATAGADLVGNLGSIDSSHAYWVQSSSFAPIKTEIPEQGFAAVPPSIAVVVGWNLVPVVSLTGASPGALIDADTYFSSVNWVAAYSFEPDASPKWAATLPKSFTNITVGKGYWLYVAEAGILVPVA